MKAKRFAARVEWVAIEPEFEKLIAMGYGIKLAHEKLLNDGKVSMPYRTFYGCKFQTIPATDST